MVTTLSSAAQASERKKVTIDKVKANHLSRQLQMRLQYARLKVEHGWQKQSLNEVENLYFHNSHLRGSRPFSTPTIVTTQPQHSTFSGAQSASTQSSLSFKLGPSSLARNSVNANTTSGQDQNASDSLPEDLNSTYDTSTTPAVFEEPFANIDPLLRPNPSQDTVVVSAKGKPPTLPPSPNSYAVGQVDMSVNENSDSSHSLSPVPDKPSTIDISQNADNNYPPVKSLRSRASKGPVGSQLSLTPKELFSFGSTSTLTYDSFWLSHSASIPRPAGMPTTNQSGSVSPRTLDQFTSLGDQT